MAPFRWIGLAGVVYLIFFARHASSAPTKGDSQPALVRPLSHQFLPVARINQSFSWTFSPQTFDPPGSLTYSSSGLPAWLSFSNDTLTLAGRPTSSDVGSYDISVTATAKDGQRSSTSDSVTLTVSTRPGPVSIKNPIPSQLISNSSTITSCYAYLTDSPFYPGVRVPPGWSFSMGFEPNTFTAPTRVFYYAVLSDGSPLPPWLTFNNQTVTFDGVAPYMANKTEELQITVAGSDTFGYADVTESFNLTIAAHDLSIKSGPTSGNTSHITLNMTSGSWTSVSLVSALDRYLTIDDSPITEEDITEVLTNPSVDWLSYSSSNMSLSGSPPGSQSPLQLPLDITDRYGDTLNTTLTISFIPSVWTSSSLGPIVINSTSRLDIDLDQVAFGSDATGKNLGEITATFNPSDASQWISIKDHTLTGTLPPNLTYSSVSVDLTAKDPNTNADSSATLTLSLSPEAIESAADDQGDKGHTLSRTVRIILGTITALIGAMISLMLALVMHRHRKEKKAEALRKLQDEAPDNEDRDEEWKWQDQSLHTPAMGHDEKLGSNTLDFDHPRSSSPSGSRVTRLSEPEMVNLPYLSSQHSTLPGDGHHSNGNTWAARTVRYLKNPFSKQATTRVMPNISHPVVMPSFPNAAFQAQLAAAVDSAGIVKRGGAYQYPETPNPVIDSTPAQTLSGTASGTATRTLTGTGIHTVSGTGETGMAASDLDGDLGSTSHADAETTDSHFHVHSSRASWESEAPFAWATSDTPGRREAASNAPDVTKNQSRLRDQVTVSGRATPSIDEVDEHRNDRGGTETGTVSSDPPVQRNDFRPVNAAGRSRPLPPSVTAVSEPDVDISIDNIHFPTDSDIAQTESSASDQEAVITTASRIDARRTLESPMGSICYSGGSGSGSGHPSPSQRTDTSYIPSRGPSPTPSGAHHKVITTQSRLVSLGKERVVTVRDSPMRDASQTAVVMSSKSGTTNQSISSAGEMSRVTPPTMRSAKEGSSSIRGLPNFPSLPAIPLPMDSAPLHRILLGVAEPFHFYPPLNISSSPSSVTTSTTSTSTTMDTKPVGKAGASYEAMVEVKEGMKPLPKWLNFEDMEIWGVPKDEHRGVWKVRVMEMVHQTGSRRTVGRFAIEVVGR